MTDVNTDHPANQPTHRTDAGDAPDQGAAELDSLDDSLADDVEQMLRGNFDSIEDLLGDDSDAESESDTGSLGGQHAAESLEIQFDGMISTSKSSRSVEVCPDDVDWHTQEQAAGLESQPDDDSANAATPSLVASTHAHVDPAAGEDTAGHDRSESDDPDEHPVSPVQESTQSTDEAAGEPDDRHEPTSGSEDDVDDSGSMAARSGSTFDQSSEASALVNEQWQQSLVSAGMASLQELLRQSSRMTVQIMAVPLMLLPERIRPVVDWVALTLAFWVPVVWALTYFVMER